MSPTAALLKFPSVVLERAKTADVQWLDSVLGAATSRKHSVVQRSIFQEKVIALLSSCVDSTKAKALHVYKPKANILRRKFDEELKRRVPCTCTACWKSVSVRGRCAAAVKATVSIVTIQQITINGSAFYVGWRKALQGLV